MSARSPFALGALLLASLPLLGSCGPASIGAGIASAGGSGGAEPGDTTPPRVLSATSSGLSQTSAVELRLVFSEAMDPLSFNAESVQLKRGTGNTDPIRWNPNPPEKLKLEYRPAEQELRVQILSTLERESSYVLGLSDSKIRDLAGNSMESAYGYEFLVPDRSWQGKASTVGRGGQQPDADFPKVASDAAGNSIFVWRQFEAHAHPRGVPKGRWNLLARYVKADGTLTRSHVFRPNDYSGTTVNGPNIMDYHVEMTGSGQAIVIWSAWTSGPDRCDLFASVFDRHGGWSRAQRLNLQQDGAQLLGNVNWDLHKDPDHGRGQPWWLGTMLDLAMSEDGRAVATWTQQSAPSRNPDQFDVWCSVYRPGSGWTPRPLRVTNVALPQEQALYPRVAINAAAGRATLAWTHKLLAYSIETAELDLQRASVGKRESLNISMPAFASAPTIAVRQSAQDEIRIIAWTEASIGATTRLRLRGRVFRDGAWQLTQYLDDGAYFAREPALGMDSAGNALLLWCQELGASLDRLELCFRRYDAQLGWLGVGDRVSIDSRGHAAEPRLHMLDDGRALAVWRQGTRGFRETGEWQGKTWTNGIAARFYDPSNASWQRLDGWAPTVELLFEDTSSWIGEDSRVFAQSPEISYRKDGCARMAFALRLIHVVQDPNADRYAPRSAVPFYAEYDGTSWSRAARMDGLQAPQQVHRGSESWAVWEQAPGIWLAPLHASGIGPKELLAPYIDKREFRLSNPQLAESGRPGEPLLVFEAGMPHPTSPYRRRNKAMWSVLDPSQQQCLAPIAVFHGHALAERELMRDPAVWHCKEGDVFFAAWVFDDQLAVWQLWAQFVDISSSGIDFQEPVLLTTSAQRGGRPRIVGNAKGQAVVLWNESQHAPGQLWASPLESGKTTRLAVSATEYRVATDEEDVAFLVWIANTTAMGEIQSTRWQLSSATPSAIASLVPTGLPRDLQLAFNAEGVARILYSQPLESGEGVVSAEQSPPPSQGWSTGWLVSSDIEIPKRIQSPSLGLDDSGAAIATWLELRTGEAPRLVSRRRSRLYQTWQNRQILESGGTAHMAGPVSLLRPDGSGLLLWSAYEHAVSKAQPLQTSWTLYLRAFQ
jgi:hypothetical protein